MPKEDRADFLILAECPNCKERHRYWYSKLVVPLTPETPAKVTCMGCDSPLYQSNIIVGA